MLENEDLSLEFVLSAFDILSSVKAVTQIMQSMKRLSKREQREGGDKRDARR